MEPITIAIIDDEPTDIVNMYIKIAQHFPDYIIICILLGSDDNINYKEHDSFLDFIKEAFDEKQEHLLNKEDYTNAISSSFINLIEYVPNKPDQPTLGAWIQALSEVLSQNNVDIVVIDNNYKGIDEYSNYVGIQLYEELKDINYKILISKVFFSFEEFLSKENNGDTISLSEKYNDIKNIQVHKFGEEDKLFSLIHNFSNLIQIEKDIDNYGFLKGSSSIMKDVISKIDRFKNAEDKIILIIGPTGSGKQLIAQAIHRNSRRNNKEFVSINCGAFKGGDPNLLKSEIFGHEQNAFTGSGKKAKIGLLEIANDGIIFIDEIQDSDRDFQNRLKIFMQEREFYRLGGTTKYKSNARIILATNKEPRQLLAADILAADFYYRIRELIIRLPTLKAREADIANLIYHFLSKEGLAKHQNRGVYRIEQEVIEVLKNYDFPGNIRELEQSISELAVLSENYNNNITMACFKESECYKEILINKITIDPSGWELKAAILYMLYLSQRQDKEYFYSNWFREKNLIRDNVIKSLEDELSADTTFPPKDLISCSILWLTKYKTLVVKDKGISARIYEAYSSILRLESKSNITDQQRNFLNEYLGISKATNATDDTSLRKIERKFLIDNKMIVDSNFKEQLINITFMYFQILENYLEIKF